MAHDPSTPNTELSLQSPPTQVDTPEPSGVSPVDNPSFNNTGELIIEYGHESQQGIRKALEDTVLIAPDIKITDSQCTSSRLSLFAVFDGHGGKTCAEYCSENYERILRKHLLTNTNISNAITESIREIDELIIANTPDGSGSTCTMLLIDRITYEIWVTNIGDSRCIKIMDNNGNDDIETVEELSIVHKPDDEEEKNRIEESEGWVTFGRVCGILAVSRALGDKDFKIELANLVISTPSIRYHKLTHLDRYIIVACDGLFDVYDGDEVQTFVDIKLDENDTPDLNEIMRQLVTDAIVKRKSRDNVTSIIVTFQYPDNKGFTESKQNDMSLSESQLNGNSSDNNDNENSITNHSEIKPRINISGDDNNRDTSQISQNDTKIGDVDYTDDTHLNINIIRSEALPVSDTENESENRNDETETELTETETENTITNTSILTPEVSNSLLQSNNNITNENDSISDNTTNTTTTQIDSSS